MPRLTKARQAERAESANQLRQWFPAGSTVYLIRRSSPSHGASTDIAPVALTPTPDGPLDRRYAAYHVARVLGAPLKDYWHGDAVRIYGYGEDRGFAMVYALATALYGDGRALTAQWL